MLDHMVTLMYSGDQASRQVAHEVLTHLKTHPDSWRAVDTILAGSQSADTKFFALNLLENVIATRWHVLPDEQKHGIKNYVVQLVIKISSDEQFANTQRHFLTKLNETLVQIVKQEWPQKWESFIPEICGSSKVNQSLCENNLRILNLLSEEVFVFGQTSMISKKVARLKDTLNLQFETIYALCNSVFQSHIAQPGSVRPSLLKTTLTTMANFMEWIPLGYVFETDLIQLLLVHFWDPVDYRIECVKCLNEIACLHTGVQQYQPQLVRCFQGCVEKIQQLPENTPEAVANLQGPQRIFWEVFHNQVALLLTGFLKHNMAAMEAQQNYMIPALNYLVRITSAPNEETFKLCVEFWQTFSGKVFLESHQRKLQPPPQTSPLLLDGTPGLGVTIDLAGLQARQKAYGPVLEKVRWVIISKMAKPPEVTIKENEEGHIVRAEEEDTDEVALYKMMREALVYLTHLDPANMEHIMLHNLSQECMTANLSQTSQEHWVPTRLNRLCWAIGSISGAMVERDEKRFLVQVIKDLLSLCEMKRGKENKAVVASNIMYVVGQYPRFLRAHWKFLKTVIIKLFEFMHETFPGVQEMAVDTFLKICQKCKKKFVAVQQGEQVTFVEELANADMAQNISELEHLHICTFFEAIGYMISAAPPEGKPRYVKMVMELFNSRWAALLHKLSQTDPLQCLQDTQTLRDISLILRANERMVSAVGACCLEQLASFYVEMLKIYKVCSDFISRTTAQQGSQVMGHTQVRLMRNVKRDTLRLVQTFVDTAAIEENALEVGLTKQLIAQQFVPPLLEPVLADYQSNMPQARDAEVLDLLATLATRLSESISAEVQRIFDMVLGCTVDMIKGDFQSFPDHRTKFYALLKAINTHCFQSLFTLPEAHLRLYVDSLIWAIKHEQPQVADSGLQILQQFLERLMSGPQHVYVSFFKIYYFTLMQDILKVLTDTFHKSGFKFQQQILLQLILVVEEGALNEAAPKPKVMEFLYDLIGKSFPTLHRSQVEISVLNCFNKVRQPAEFQQHIRDFLITLRECGSHEDWFYEEDRQTALRTAQVVDAQWRSQVPGLVPQHDPSRAADGDMDEL